MVQVRQIDAAGNVSDTFELPSLTIDISVLPPSGALASDTGVSTTDGITNDATVAVGGLEPGASWQYSTNGGTTWQAGTGTSFELARALTPPARCRCARRTSPAISAARVPCRR
ncbi:hypothetical protein ACFSHP_21310 [Novosphingobium panipatense]